MVKYSTNILKELSEYRYKIAYILLQVLIVLAVFRCITIQSDNKTFIITFLIVICLTCINLGIAINQVKMLYKRNKDIEIAKKILSARIPENGPKTKFK